MANEEFLPASLALFNTNPTQTAIESSEVVEYSPLNSINNGNIIDFRVIGTNTYVSLNEIYLHASVQLVKEDLTSYSETDSLQPTLCNNVISSLIKSVQLSLNNTPIVSVHDAYCVKDIIEGKCNFDLTCASSKLGAAGFFTDADEGKLKKRLANSKIADFYAKLNVCNLDRYLLNNIDLNLNIVFNNENYFIIEASSTSTPTTTTKSKFLLKDFKLSVRHIKVRESFNLYMEASLARSNANYEFKSATVHQLSIATGSVNASSNSLFVGLRPSLIIATLISTKLLNGERTKDPHIYSHHGLQEFSFIINGDFLPRKPHSIKDTSEESKFTRLFTQLHHSLMMGNENQSTMITTDNFLAKNFFIAEDLTSNGHGLTSINDPLYPANIGFNCTFTAATTEPLTILLYILSPHKFEITQDRSIQLLY
jgi:hypothetical protein